MVRIARNKDAATAREREIMVSEGDRGALRRNPGSNQPRQAFVKLLDNSCRS
jgi:hypothetical protein